MTVWQYAQLRVTYDNRLAAGGGKWTIAWYGPNAPRQVRAGVFGDVVAELNRAGAEGWELVGVAALDAGDSRRFPDKRDWSLTSYTFRRPYNATAKKSTEPIQQGEAQQWWPAGVAAPAQLQHDRLAGSKTTEPVTLVRLTAYWLLDSEPGGNLAGGHGSGSAAGRRLIRYKAVRRCSPADIDVIEALRVEYQHTDVNADRREKIEAAAADYAASWVEGKFDVTWWQSPQSFPLSQAADVLDGSADWLRGLVKAPLAYAASTAGAAAPLTDSSADITADAVTAALTVPLEDAALICEIAGIFIGLATGAHPLVMACAHRLAHDESGRLLSKGFEQIFDSIGARPKPAARAAGTRGDQANKRAQPGRVILPLPDKSTHTDIPILKDAPVPVLVDGQSGESAEQPKPTPAAPTPARLYPGGTPRSTAATSPDPSPRQPDLPGIKQPDKRERNGPGIPEPGSLRSPRRRQPR
jgi:hypothetical protein